MHAWMFACVYIYTHDGAVCVDDAWRKTLPRPSGPSVTTIIANTTFFAVTYLLAAFIK